MFKLRYILNALSVSRTWEFREEPPRRSIAVWESRAVRPGTVAVVPLPIQRGTRDLSFVLKCRPESRTLELLFRNTIREDCKYRIIEHVTERDDAAISPTGYVGNN